MQCVALLLFIQPFWLRLVGSLSCVIIIVAMLCIELVDVLWLVLYLCGTADPWTCCVEGCCYWLPVGLLSKLISLCHGSDAAL
jgi:hypothetical protein